MISGMRNDPPISTSSPRDTTASPPRASALSARSSAPAALLTTSASAAPVSSTSRSRQWACREPRVPRPKSYSSAAYPRATRVMEAIAASASGARPRFVCSTTPVALITGASDGSANRSAAARTAASHPSGGIAPPLARAASTARRAAFTTSARGWSESSAATPGPARSASMDGSCRLRSVMGAWGVGRGARYRQACVVPGAWCRPAQASAR